MPWEFQLWTTFIIPNMNSSCGANCKANQNSNCYPITYMPFFAPVRSFCLTGWYFSIWGSWLGNTIDDFLFFSTADCMTLLMLASREEVHSLLSLFSATKMCCIFNNRFFCFKQVHLFSWNYNTTKSSLLHPSSRTSIYAPLKLPIPFHNLSLLREELSTYSFVETPFPTMHFN